MHASKVIASLSSIFLATTVLAQTAAQARPVNPQQQRPMAPSPVRVEPATVKIGEVAPLSTHPASFILRNTGATAVVVRGAKPSCKCTGISDIIGQTIAPGGTLELKASLKAPPTPGPKDATVFVTFDPGVPPVQAKIEGNIVMPVRAEPAFVDALKGVRGGTILVSAPDGKPFRILRAGGVAPVFEGFDPAKDAPRAEYRLRWDLTGRDAAMPLWWSIFTDRADCPIVPLRVRNEATGSKWDMVRFDRQWIIPDSILFAGSMEAGKAKELTFELEYYNPGNQRPKKDDWAKGVTVAVREPNFVVELLEVKPTAGDFNEVRIRVTPGAASSGAIESSLVVTTATGTGEIPFVATVSAPATTAVP